MTGSEKRESRGWLVVIDDEPDVAEFMRKAAAGAGFAVHVADGAPDFQRACRDLAPAAVIVDIIMPGADGIEIVTWLAERKFCGKVVVISGSQPNYARAAKMIGESKGGLDIATYAKPISLHDLRAVLATV